MHDYNDLIKIFEECFYSTHNTRLVKGDDEPIYLPADADCPYHSIVFAHGFFSSALHECAHWFIAGEQRRRCVDYGYWYTPDGRTAEQQQIFQQVEIKPQAIEWILSKAAQFRFHFSNDNLSGDKGDVEAFQIAVAQQVTVYEHQGLPKRAKLFQQALMQFYGS